ncbi:MAG TPA: DMT family transporter [Stellaceae bacterium]|nr:DMT family transporter [Stellaceae bacterium]
MSVEIAGTAGSRDRPLLAAPGGTADNPMLGILLTLVAMAVFSCMDAISKHLTEHLPVMEVGWARYLICVLLLLPSVARGRFRTLHSAVPRLQVLRALGMAGSSVFFIMAVAQLPLAEATSIGFVSPLFITALSVPFLGEKVGIRRWSAIVVGLIGVTIVVRPGSSAFDPAALLPLASAASWAVGIILTRKMSSSDTTLTTLTYTNLVGLVICTAIIPAIWVTPGLDDALLFLIAGTLSAVGQWLLITAYRRAATSTLAPFQYSQLLWSTALGFVFFGSAPDAVTWAGAAIIVASGAYTVHREHVLHRAASAVRP